MRMISTVGVSVLCCIHAVSAAAPRAARAQEPASTARAAVRATGPLADSLRAFAVNMGALLRAKNTDAVIALYGDTTHFVHVEDGVVMPWSELARSMRTFFAAPTPNEVRLIGEPGVTMIDRNTAVLYVTHSSNATAGRPAHAGVWTGVLRRGADGWRIVHSHSSDRRSPAGARSDFELVALSPRLPH